MVQRIDVVPPSQERFGNPTPLGLLGLAIACGALLPIAFGLVEPKNLIAAFKTASVFSWLFGGGCQLLAGLMLFGNKNVYGGTVFTAFSFNWAVTGWTFWSVANGQVPDHTTGLATEIVLFVIFVVLTYGFGFFSKLLFVFLLDIDFLFVFRVVRSVTGTHAMDLPIALATLVLMLVSLWIAFGSLLNPLAGKVLFAIGGPIFSAPQKDSFDWTLRRAIFDTLYAHWTRDAFREMPVAQLEAAVAAKAPGRPLTPDLFYLAEFGYVKLTPSAVDSTRAESVRLTAQGIDLHEQWVLHKYQLVGPLAH
jgi:succinate-acetate transporter protein